MNVFGDTCFDMYFGADAMKDLKLTLSKDTIQQSILQENRRKAHDKKCYCLDVNEALPVSVQEKPVTECLISSLNVTNAENLLSLMQNYVSEELVLSELSLGALLAFLMNASNCAAEKHRIESVLHEQLQLHPSCAAHMVSRYRALMLTKDEEFANLTLLEFAISKIEKLVSVEGSVCITDTRSSRRRRKLLPLADESPVKRSKIEVYVDSDEEQCNAVADREVEPDVSHLLAVVDHLTQILRHDLGHTLKCEQPLRNCILAHLMFNRAGESFALNTGFFAKICGVYKNSESLSVQLCMSHLLELIGNVCALIEDSNFDLHQLGFCSRMLVNEFCIGVFGVQPKATARIFTAVSTLQPEWLRHHAAHYLITKILEQKAVPLGIKGVVKVFKSMRKSLRPDPRKQPKAGNILKSVNGNQLTNAGAESGDMGAKKMTKSEFADIAEAKHSSLKNCKTSPRLVGTIDNKEKCFETNSCQKLSPIVCKILMVYVDSTIKLIRIAGVRDCENVTYNYNKLKNILNDICGEKNVASEVNMIRRRLNKIPDL